jgi:hypothetical protein
MPTEKWLQTHFEIVKGIVRCWASEEHSQGSAVEQLLEVGFKRGDFLELHGAHRDLFAAASVTGHHGVRIEGPRRNDLWT